MMSCCIYTTRASLSSSPTEVPWGSPEFRASVLVGLVQTIAARRYGHNLGNEQACASVKKPKCSTPQARAIPSSLEPEVRNVTLSKSELLSPYRSTPSFARGPRFVFGWPRQCFSCFAMQHTHTSGHDVGARHGKYTLRTARTCTGPVGCPVCGSSLAIRGKRLGIQRNLTKTLASSIISFRAHAAKAN